MKRLDPQPTPRTRVRRRAGRGRYDRATIDPILDEGMVGHLGLVSERQPYVLPILYARDGDWLYLHGSPLSRLLGAAVSGVPLCLTVTLLDGLVFARSAFHHSMNYRSVVVLGSAVALEDHDAKQVALRRIVEHIAPGRSDEVRGPSGPELEATEVVAMEIREASAKIRTGPPVDAAEDYSLPVWAGELPLALVPGAPAGDPRCEFPVPDYVSSWRRENA
jgi:nitroimidazol reductase NimA-like FMN-containing flavoprotein (pyridoxamine 5'-phosphate oxidase superfamily)